jgi:hypothetical protein
MQFLEGERVKSLKIYSYRLCKQLHDFIRTDCVSRINSSSRTTSLFRSSQIVFISLMILFYYHEHVFAHHALEASYDHLNSSNGFNQVCDLNLF